MPRYLQGNSMDNPLSNIDGLMLGQAIFIRYAEQMSWREFYFAVYEEIQQADSFGLPRIK